MRFASTSTLAVGLLASAAFGGCVTAIGITGDTGGAGIGGGTGSAQGSGGAGAMCVPAAAEGVLRTCTACHSSPPAKGVPSALVSLADLQKPSPKGGTNADRSVIRMKDANSPMPPDGLLPAAQVAAFEAWVKNGMPLEACPSNTSGSGANGTTGSGAGNGASNGAGNGSGAGNGASTSVTTSGGATTTGSGGGGPPTTCAQANDVVGCCDTSGTLYYCNGTTMTSQSCTGGSVCGWNATAGYYDCVASAGSDPSGTYPKACGGGGTTSTTSATTSSTSGGGGGITWTQLYNGVFGPTGTSACTGSSCHTNTKSGFKCGTSKTTCYNGFVSSGYITPGANASSSPLIDPAQSCLCGSLGGNMPAGSAPCITNTQLTQLKSWLASGAPNN